MFGAYGPGAVADHVNITYLGRQQPNVTHFHVRTIPTRLQKTINQHGLNHSREYVVNPFN